MARLRLRTQLLIATLVIICTLTGALLLIVRHTVRSGIDRQVRDSTYASLRAFESVQRQREQELSRTAAMLAELPTLKALMTSEDAPTIQDASQPFWKLAGSDLLLLASPDARVLGFHVMMPGWSARLIEKDLRRSLTRGEESAWWYNDGQLYWVFLRPISAGSGKNRKPLGVVAVGYQVDSSVAEQLALVAGSEIALVMGDKVIASTLSPAEEARFVAWIAGQSAHPDVDALPIALGSGQYQLASVSLREGAQAPVLCYVLVSLQRASSFIQGLNRTIFLLGISAVIFAALLLGFVSRTITRPLDNLVAGVRALASGDYTYSITPRGSSEVAELGRAFSKMRADLMESQRRWLATERVAALGRAASSISHDLRHYLATVVANAEFLYESERLKLNRDEIFSEIQTASEQMTELLESLRELSREGATVSPAPGSMEQAIRHAVDSVHARPEFRHASISVNTSGDMEGVFDSKKMQRVFFNLLLNACEASSPNACCIEVDARSSPDSFEVRVIDHASGIPEAVRNSLFDPFVSSGKTNGTGMGLAIVHKIVQDHGGSVLVENSSSAGSIFLVRLPRVLSQADPKEKVGPAPGKIRGFSSHLS
jgi:signal transduction histidine kinase